MAYITNVNGLRVVTGGQVGSLDMQFILIRCYNTPFTLTPTQPSPPNPVQNYEFISNANDGFSQLIQVVQDWAEIYYIGIPEANSGGETDLTRVVVGINPVTARSLPDGQSYPTAAGRWTLLEAALDDYFGGGSEVWFAMPGIGWTWDYDN